MRLLLALVFAFTLAACDSGTDGPYPDPATPISGRYTGAATVQGIVLNHVFVLQEAVPGTVTGTLTITAAPNGVPYNYQIRGVHTGATFDLDYGGMSDGLDYTGSAGASANTLTGVMDWREGTDPLPDYSVAVTRDVAAP
ncbi:MAG TPA: hypothetical protein VGB53_02695 [Rubricoccaceae bacterium]|jgi:hypothetical protein